MPAGAAAGAQPAYPQPQRDEVFLNAIMALGAGAAMRCRTSPRAAAASGISMTIESALC